MTRSVNSAAALPTAAAAAGLPIAVDPEMQAALDRVAAVGAGFPDPMTVPIAVARRISVETRRWVNQGGPVMESTQTVAVPLPDGSTVPARLYRPQTGGRPLPCLVYAHGGGWALCSLDTHDRFLRELGVRAGCAVLSVDYGLAPETKFPASARQCAAAVDWVHGEGAEHGLDPTRIAIGGDSAGGNLAATAMLLLREAGRADLLSLGLIIYGALDTDFETASYRRYAEGPYLLTASKMRAFWKLYLRGEADYADPLAAPARADLRGLPPVFVPFAEIDVLHDDSIAFLAALSAAGVPAEARVYPGLTHGFCQFSHLVAGAGRAVDDMAAALRGAFGT